MRLGTVSLALVFVAIVGAGVACGRVADPDPLLAVLLQNGRLASLTVSNGTLTPAFDPYVTDYVIADPASDGWNGATIVVTATAADPAATISIDERPGAAPVSVHRLPGRRTFAVVVSAPDGSQVTYTLRSTVAPAEVATLTSPPARDLGAPVALSADGKTMLRSGAPDQLTVLAAGSTWRTEATLAAPKGFTFGTTAALSADGRTIAVQAVAPFPATNAVVYVFSRNGAKWSAGTPVAPAQLPADAQFGRAIALTADGNGLAVGAPNDATVSADSGGTYVFARTGEAWAQTAALHPSNAATGRRSYFGNAVAISGDGNTLLVGAPLDSSKGTGVNPTSPGPENMGALNAGAAFVYARSGAIWSQVAYVKASNTATGETDPVGWNGPTSDPTLDKMAGGLFGEAVALSRDGRTLAVAAPWEMSSGTGVDGVQDNRDARHSGAVYLFGAENGTWSQIAYVKASNTTTGGQAGFFGEQIALSDDGAVLAVGAAGEGSIATGVNPPAPAEDDDSAPGSGAVYMFTRWEGAWGQRAYVKPAQRVDATFGALALSGDGLTLAVGEAPRTPASLPGGPPSPSPQTTVHVFH